MPRAPIVGTVSLSTTKGFRCLRSKIIYQLQTKHARGCAAHGPHQEPLGGTLPIDCRGPSFCPVANS
ncbi:hypothetical protein VTI28DRAFT_6415 [Corynascus sepedonium]